LVNKDRTEIAIFAMIMAVVGAAYYLRLMVALWAATAKEPAKAPSPVLARWALSAAAVATLALIAWPNVLVKPGARGAAMPTATIAAPQLMPAAR
jgi:NADH:ubiquinone oxidoreductase subunit 2 (subunit N)